MKWHSHRQGGRSGSRFPRHRREPPAPVTAGTSAFTQLLAARKRHLASSQELAIAGDLRPAIDAFYDADAISGELVVVSGR